jgi:P27 family predicted phage terminase small subunit
MKAAVKIIYLTIVEELRHADILNNSDIELISTTAYAIYRMKDARKHLDKQGSVITDDNGKMFKSPYVQVEKDYQPIFHTGCLQLGLSPSSRAKLALMATQNKEDDEDDDF